MNKYIMITPLDEVLIVFKFEISRSCVIIVFVME